MIWIKDDMDGRWTPSLDKRWHGAMKYYPHLSRFLLCLITIIITILAILTFEHFCCAWWLQQTPPHAENKQKPWSLPLSRHYLTALGHYLTLSDSIWHYLSLLRHYQDNQGLLVVWVFEKVESPILLHVVLKFNNLSLHLNLGIGKL